MRERRAAHFDERDIDDEPRFDEWIVVDRWLERVEQSLSNRAGRPRLHGDVDGLGVKASVQRGTTIGTTILVCDARPFETGRRERVEPRRPGHADDYDRAP